MLGRGRPDRLDGFRLSIFLQKGRIGSFIFLTARSKVGVTRLRISRTGIHRMALLDLQKGCRGSRRRAGRGFLRRSCQFETSNRFAADDGVNGLRQVLA